MAPDLEPRLLRTFVAVAEELHFGRAADRLHLAQGAVSGQVKRLEEELGVLLLHRTSRSVELTPAGAVLLDQARQMLEASAEAVKEVQRADRGQTGTLVVGLATTLPRELVQTALDAFATARADVEIVQRESPWTDPSGGVAEGHVDLAFVRPPFTPAGITVEHLWSEPRVALLGADHPLAAHDVLDIADLLDEPWAGSDGDPVWRAFWTAEAERGGPPRYASMVSSLDGLLDTVRHAGAVGLIPASAGERIEHVAGLTVRPVQGTAPSTVAIAWRPDAASALARAFVAMAQRVIGSAQ